MTIQPTQHTHNGSQLSHKGVLYLLVCGCGAARDMVVPTILAAQKRGWTVCVTVTPNAVQFVDLAQLTDLTGYPARVQYKQVDTVDLHPKADAILAYPLTFSSLNKWAQGIGDTVVTSLLAEYTGYANKPIVGVPCFPLNGGLDTNPILHKHIRVLREECGVTIVFELEAYQSNRIPPDIVLDILDRLLQKQRRLLFPNNTIPDVSGTSS